jgi:hypothetical protein
VLGYNDIATQGFDNSGNYNSTAFTWTVSIPAVYSFRIFLEFFTTKLAGATLCHWDSSGVLLRGIRLGTGSAGGANWLGAGTVFEPKYQTVNQTVGGYSANVGDVFQIILEVATRLGQNDTIDGDVYLSEDSYWEIQGSSLPSSGGTIINIDSGTNYFVENELEGYVPADTWAQIRSNPFNKYRYLVSDDGTNRVGFLKDFSRNIISGKFNGVTIPETLTPNDNNTIQSDGETEPEEPEEPEE